MRIVLADLASADGFVSKDTVVGGYGSRLRPFSKVTRAVCAMKRRLHDLPSVQLGYIAALCAAAGHEVVYTEGDAGRRRRGHRADVARRLTSTKRRGPTRSAGAGMRVGFVGLTASKLPELFDAHGDFVVMGEPETAVMALAARDDSSQGACRARPSTISHACRSRAGTSSAASRAAGGRRPSRAGRSGGALSAAGQPRLPGVLHLLPASHPRLAPDRAAWRTSPTSSSTSPAIQQQPYVVFRDPLFTDDRERCLALCDEIRARGLQIRFECETRLDRLDPRAHRRAAPRRPGGDQLRRGDDLARNAEARRAPADSARASAATSSPNAAAAASSRAAFYVFGFLQDDWSSIAATIDYAIDMGSTVAQFKLLTPVSRARRCGASSRRSSTRRTGSGSTATRRRSPIRR